MSVGARGASLGRAVTARSISLSFPQKLILAFALAIGVPLFGYAALMHAIDTARMDAIDQEALDQRLTIVAQHIRTTGAGLVSVAATAAALAGGDSQPDHAAARASRRRLLQSIQAINGLAAGAIVSPDRQRLADIGIDTALDGAISRSKVALAAISGDSSWSVIAHRDHLALLAASPLTPTQTAALPGPAVVVARVLDSEELAAILGRDVCKVAVRGLPVAERAEYPHPTGGRARAAGFRQVALPSSATRDTINKLVLLDGVDPSASVLLDVTMDRSALPARGPRSVTVALCAFSFSLLLAALLASLVSGWVSRPLDELEKQVLEAEGAGRQCLLPVVGNDSLSRLARAFNRMLVEREETQARALHNERLAMAGEMSAAIAHEVKNVLAPIHLRAEMLLQTVADPAVRENLEGMRAEMDRSAALLRSLLELSRQGAPEFRAVLIGDTVRRATQLVTPVAARAKTDLMFEDGAPHTLVWGDQSELLQTVLNLVNNAIDAGARNVAVRTELVNNHLELVVRDDGCGMDETVRTHALEPFFTTKPVGEGTGLGLSICHSVVEAHRGTIGIESSPHHGTRITICLPIAGEG